MCRVETEVEGGVAWRATSAEQRRDEDRQTNQLADAEARRAQGLATTEIGRHMAGAHQDVHDRENVGDPARAADDLRDDHSRGEPRKSLQAIEVGAVSAHGLPLQIAETEARLFRIEALD